MSRPLPRTGALRPSPRGHAGEVAGGQHGAPCPPTGALRTGSILDVLGQIARLHGDLAEAYGTLAEDAGKALADVAKLSLTRTTMPPPREMPADLLTATDLARLLKCDPRTVRRMELDGRLPSPIGHGRMKRWRRADIERRVG